MIFTIDYMIIFKKKKKNYERIPTERKRLFTEKLLGIYLGDIW